MKIPIYKEVMTPIIHIFDMSDISRNRQIILLVLRIVATIGIMTFFIMWLFTDAIYMKWFFGGLAITCFLIPELTVELSFRDFPGKGIFNIPHKIRLLTIPFFYAAMYILSPILYRFFWPLLSDGYRSLGGDRGGFQTALWLVLSKGLSYWPIAPLFAILLLFVSGFLCYLISSKSWRRSITAVTLLILMEAAAALTAGNSPG